MARFDFQAKGLAQRPHDDQPQWTMAPVTLYHEGTIEAPDVYAARYQARRHCERMLGMAAVTVTKCILSTRQVD